MAIKQLGTNGGGFFNANSAHPFENPNGLTNFLEILGAPRDPVVARRRVRVLIGIERQARVLLGVMAGLLVLISVLAMVAEADGNPDARPLGVDQATSTIQRGGNMEGKEVRFGPASCGLWAGSTTGTSNGSVNCMHDSFTPVGGMVPMLQMMLGEVIPGGVGVGLMGMLIYALLAVFIAGLMVGRTPEYLGKKIQAAEMKLVVAVHPGDAGGAARLRRRLRGARPARRRSRTRPARAVRGALQLLFGANNNGSAFAGQGTGTDWYTVTQGLAMLIGRFLLIIPALAIGGSLARKPRCRRRPAPCRPTRHCSAAWSPGSSSSSPG